MCAKQSGSPVRMRTCNPVVNSLGVKCFVFSSDISLQTALRDAKSLLGSAKLIVLRSESAACSIAYFAAATENASLVAAAVVTAALGHVKDLPSRSCAALGLCSGHDEPSASEITRGVRASSASQPAHGSGSQVPGDPLARCGVMRN
jgi:hypothetical protein